MEKSKASLEKLKKELQEQDIVLLIIPKEDYSSELEAVLKAITPEKTIAYISANKPQKSLMKIFDRIRIEKKNVLVIDCITTNVAEENPDDSPTIYIRIPSDLTGISLAMTAALERGADMVLVDAISTFMIYHDEAMVIRFAHSMITRVRNFNKKGVFIIINDEASKSIVNQMCMFADSVVEL